MQGWQQPFNPSIFNPVCVKRSSAWMIRNWQKSLQLQSKFIVNHRQEIQAVKGVVLKLASTCRFSQHCWIIDTTDSDSMILSLLLFANVIQCFLAIFCFHFLIVHMDACLLITNVWDMLVDTVCQAGQDVMQITHSNGVSSVRSTGNEDSAPAADDQAGSNDPLDDWVHADDVRP